MLISMIKKGNGGQKGGAEESEYSDEEALL
jgi:hypothetical protein